MPLPGIDIVVDEYGELQYPFMDAATRTARDGRVLPAGAIEDIRIYRPNRGSGTYLYSICTGAEPGDIDLIFNDDKGKLGTATFATAETSAIIYDEYNRDVGVIRININKFPQLGDGIDCYEFRQSATMLDGRCVVCLPVDKVEGIVDADDQLATGVLALVGSNGVVITEDSDGTVRINLVGEPYWNRKLCDTSGAPGTTELPYPLKTLNIKVTDTSSAEIALQPSTSTYGGVSFAVLSNDPDPNTLDALSDPVLTVRTESDSIIIEMSALAE